MCAFVLTSRYECGKTLGSSGQRSIVDFLSSHYPQREEDSRLSDITMSSPPLIKDEDTSSSQTRTTLRSLLRHYYGLERDEARPFDYDSATFRPDAYFERLLKDKPRKELIQLDSQLGVGKYGVCEMWNYFGF
jgi:hypothetical protein